MNDSYRVLLLALLMSIAGCVDPGTMPTDPDVESTADPNSAGSMKSEHTMEQDRDRTAGTIELPQTMLSPAIADLAVRLGTDERDVEVLRAIPVLWNDGSLGCPQPDMAYTQAVVPGYWVVMEHAGQRYSYHAGRSGRLRLCEDARPTLTGAPPHGRYNDSV